MFFFVFIANYFKFNFWYIILPIQTAHIVFPFLPFLNDMNVVGHVNYESNF